MWRSSQQSLQTLYLKREKSQGRSLEEKALSLHDKSIRMQNIFPKLNLQICLNNDWPVKCFQKFFDDSLEYKQY